MVATYKVVKCGECWEKDIALSTIGQYRDDEKVTYLDLRILQEDQAFQCDDCLKQNEAYEEL
jgi:hypothetical protein